MYESRFQFKELDGWVLSGVTATSKFTTCGIYTIFGGYGVFAVTAGVTKTVTGLPTHTQRKWRVCMLCVVALLGCWGGVFACCAWWRCCWRG